MEYEKLTPDEFAAFVVTEWQEALRRVPPITEVMATGITLDELERCAIGLQGVLTPQLIYNLHPHLIRVVARGVKMNLEPSDVIMMHLHGLFDDECFSLLQNLYRNLAIPKTELH